MAGHLKRANPDVPENLVLIRALRDSNIPKFLADDSILFQVFPHLWENIAIALFVETIVGSLENKL